MRVAGSPSWSTRESLDAELHRLLFVRQALVGRTVVAQHLGADAGGPGP